MERRVGVNKLVVHLFQRCQAYRRNQNHAGQGRAYLQNYQKGNLSKAHFFVNFIILGATSCIHLNANPDFLCFAAFKKIPNFSGLAVYLYFLRFENFKSKLSCGFLNFRFNSNASGLKYYLYLFAIFWPFLNF